jgi:hypothetical protein
MTTLSLKLPVGLNARLEAAARKKGRTKSEVVREAIEAFLATGVPSRAGSCLDLARDLAGSVKGPGDLSYSKKHLRGYGK